MPAIPELASISGPAALSRVWYLDIWGVLHNGVRPFSGAVDACQRFRKAGGIVVLVSNSPRPRDGVRDQLDKIGVARDAYDGIVTSGDVSRVLIAAHAGKKVFHLGPGRDLPIYAGTGVELSSNDGAATVVICTGLFDDERETPADYGARLSNFAKAGRAMICVNPDKTVERGGRIIYCAGALAEAYEALGGRVHYAGKPYAPIYAEAHAIASTIAGVPIDAAEILAIGDGVKTDILGASRNGLNSVYVASAVHAGRGEQLADAAVRLFPDSEVRPIGVMSGLRW